MIRKGHSRSHKSPSYKVHYHQYIVMYRYTYIMCNAITQSKKVKQTLPTFQEYGPTRYRKCKIDIAIPREHGPSKQQEDKRGYMNGDPNTCSREEALKRGKKKTTLEGLGPLIYWSLPFVGLHHFSCILALFARAQEVVPLLQVSLLHVCTCKEKRNKLAEKQRNKQRKIGRAHV